MLILIAESKTMTPCDCPVSHDDYTNHRPALENIARETMDALKNTDASTLARTVKISLPMAQKLVRMIYDFPDKSSGAQAIEAYTGVVFKAFEYKSLDSAGQERTSSQVRIISSLYGWLRPDDIIKPYRFDFTTPLSPDGSTLAAGMRPHVTNCVMEYLRARNCTEILNLLPGDAAKCIDWKIVEKEAKVYRADFREIVSGTETKTPNSNRLKTLRGRLLRQIVQDNLTSAQSLLALASDCYISDPQPEPDGTITFTTA